MPGYSGYLIFLNEWKGNNRELCPDGALKQIPLIKKLSHIREQSQEEFFSFFAAEQGALQKFVAFQRITIPVFGT